MDTGHQQDSKSELQKSTERPNVCPYSFTTTSESNSSAKTSVEYDINATLDIKEEIIQDEQDSKIELQNSTGIPNGCPYSSTTTSGSNSSANTLIKYEIDKTLDIKEEIIQVPEKIIVQEQHKTYEFISCSVHIKEEDMLDVDRVHHKTSSEKSVVARKVKKQIICDYCAHESSKKRNLIRHITLCHLLASEFRHKCDKCARSYKWPQGLSQHKRLTHSDTSTKFICDYCERKWSRKINLARHITSRHLQALNSRHKCHKCERSYKWPQGLTSHKRLVHSDAGKKFICDYCEHKWSSKINLSRHITSRHLQASDSRLKCDKCERSYNWPQSLTRHRLAYHAAVQ
ncbi:zinc finger Y-chromosomal protein-like [Belonocnema kinseyi]|uniref:zinc finger Y-chromosomal protein-like n=1 Tax=Belonocnema kinseyi TaxID=2817044 RepID=UPI00143DCD29|nr:zinc finger Y-chromosomal protein-like [Belonocnema kinseyi]